MAGGNETDDEDTKEQPIASRYPDAAPAGEGAAEPTAAGSPPPAEAWASQRPAQQWPVPGEPVAGQPTPASPGSAQPTQPALPAAGEGTAMGQGWPAGTQSSEHQPQAGQQWAQPTAPWPTQTDQPWQQPGAGAGHGQAPAGPGADQWPAQTGQQWQAPPGQWQAPPGQWQGQPGQQWQGQPGWGPPPGFFEAEYPTSAMVAIAGVILFVFGLFVTLIGVGGLALGSLINEALLEFGPIDAPGFDVGAISGVIVVIFGIFLLLGILHLVSAIGVFVHKQWARIVAIVLSILGALLGLVSVVVAVDTRGRADGSELGVAVVIAFGYGFSLFALIAGGGHFRRRYRR